MIIIPGRFGRVGVTTRLALANAGLLQLVYLELLDVIPSRAAALGSKTTTLALVISSGAVVAVLSGVASGMVADRRQEAGRSYRAVLVVGIAISLFAAVACPAADSTMELLLAWALCQLGLSACLTIATAVLVCWFPPVQRGRASAAAGLGQVVGAIVASGVTSAMGRHLVVASIVAVVLAAAFTAPMIASDVWAWCPNSSPNGFLGTVPADARLRYRDTRLAWGVRAIITFSDVLVVTYVSYFAVDALHIARPQRFVGLAAGVTAVCVLAGAVWSGRRSDRTGRRKGLVATSAVVMAVGEAALAALRVPWLVVAACAVIGVGYGIYLAVDQALTVDVLPGVRSLARDVGIMNASTTLPQAVAPACAAGILQVTSSYAVLFATGALVCLLAVRVVFQIRSVR